MLRIRIIGVKRNEKGMYYCISSSFELSVHDIVPESDFRGNDGAV